MPGAIASISRPRTRRALALLLGAALLASWFACDDASLAGVVAQFGPALLLLGVLASGSYPGEVALDLLRRSLPVRRRRPAQFRSARSSPQLAFAFRTRLLAYHLAVRPPPAGAVA